MALERGNVGPGAEGTTCSRDDNNPDGVVEFDAIQSVHDGRNQLVANRVQFLWSIERKDRDWAPIFTQEEGRGLLFSFSIGSHLSLAS